VLGITKHSNQVVTTYANSAILDSLQVPNCFLISFLISVIEWMLITLKFVNVMELLQNSHRQEVDPSFIVALPCCS
jgi:hypothetical protein